ncbi:MAG: glycosyltransferase, partial [Azonexus sp.]
MKSDTEAQLSSNSHSIIAAPLNLTMTQPDTLVIIIPAFNEETTISTVVDRIIQRWRWPVIVVDDCSTDATATLAQAAGATVLPLTLQL